MYNRNKNFYNLILEIIKIVSPYGYCSGYSKKEDKRRLYHKKKKAANLHR